VRSTSRVAALSSFLLVALVTLSALSGCSAPSVIHRRQAVRLEAKAQVALVKITATNIFIFSVTNLSREMLVVNRNAVRLHTPLGTMLREAGGASALYIIPPGTSRRVNVKFHIDGLPANSAVRAVFKEALSIRGEPVEIDPIELIVE
jgi:hypothetical protein